MYALARIGIPRPRAVENRGREAGNRRSPWPHCDRICPAMPGHSRGQYPFNERFFAVL